jgi:hypothetical protein
MGNELTSRESIDLMKKSFEQQQCVVQVFEVFMVGLVASVIRQCSRYDQIVGPIFISNLLMKQVISFVSFMVTLLQLSLVYRTAPSYQHNGQMSTVCNSFF